eukprot:SAG11_NODE_4404_length_1910_cov_1.432358_2_plen_84_part_00
MARVGAEQDIQHMSGDLLETLGSMFDEDYPHVQRPHTRADGGVRAGKQIPTHEALFILVSDLGESALAGLAIPFQNLLGQPIC